MTLFGFHHPKNIKISRFNIQKSTIKIGDYLFFCFQLTNTDVSKIKLRLEYAIYYQKANGTLSKKVYKISEKEYQENSVSLINKKQSFKQISTRKFHFGLHQIAIVINGFEYDKNNFLLVN